MNELKLEIAEYLIEVDRAVTVEEVSKELDKPSNEVWNVLENLLDENYVTSDIFGDKVRVNRYYPTDDLINDFS